ncbi:hypothetical protein [Agrococcus versicolor]
MATVTIDRDHYGQLLLSAGQDHAEATATAIGNGAGGGPGPSFAALVADAFAVDPAAADELADAYRDALRELCGTRGLAVPDDDAMLDGIRRDLRPRRHPGVSLEALVAHLGRERDASRAAAAVEDG